MNYFNSKNHLFHIIGSVHQEERFTLGHLDDTASVFSSWNVLPLTWQGRNTPDKCVCVCVCVTNVIDDSRQPEVHTVIQEVSLWQTLNQEVQHGPRRRADPGSAHTWTCWLTTGDTCTTVLSRLCDAHVGDSDQCSWSTPRLQDSRSTRAQLVSLRAEVRVEWKRCVCHLANLPPPHCGLGVFFFVR